MIVCNAMEVICLYYQLNDVIMIKFNVRLVYNMYEGEWLCYMCYMYVGG